MKKFIVVVLDKNSEPIESFGSFNSETEANEWLDIHEKDFSGEEVVILPCSISSFNAKKSECAMKEGCKYQIHKEG